VRIAFDKFEDVAGHTIGLHHRRLPHLADDSKTSARVASQAAEFSGKFETENAIALAKSARATKRAK